MTDDNYMRRCLELAELGLGRVAPNPLVGCVIVNEGLIIGEGYHMQYGGPHAEVNAIRHALCQTSENALRTSTLYVNLEPCVHHGKTPPCTDLIISRGIPKVVIANVDPFHKVQGAGIEKLRAAGIEVATGVLEKEGAELNRRFFTFHTRMRPYLILKFAQSSDGFIAPEFPNHENRWISNEWSRKLVHRWRSEEPAILIGTATALADNPHLTVRLWNGPSPIRMVVDRYGRLPRQLNIFNQQIPTWVFTTQNRDNEHNITFIRLDDSPDFFRQLLSALHERSVQSLLVEGGRQLFNALLAEQLWDEARIFTSPAILQKGIPAPALAGRLISQEMISDDRLTVFRPENL